MAIKRNSLQQELQLPNDTLLQPNDPITGKNYEKVSKTVFWSHQIKSVVWSGLYGELFGGFQVELKKQLVLVKFNFGRYPLIKNLHDGR